MLPRYEDSTGHVILEWMERKDKKSSPTPHHYGKQPIHLQFHPKDERHIIRAHFPGAMPTWVKRYCEAERLQSGQVIKDGKTAWWIANWQHRKTDMRIFSAPTLDGAINQLKQRIPDVVEEFRDRIERNRTAIHTNLTHYPNDFERYGLYYRREEMQGVHGCMCLDADVIPKHDFDLTDDQYRRVIMLDGKLEKLIHELTTPMPEPVVEEVEETELITLEEEESEESFTFDDFFDEEETEEELLLDEFEMEDESFDVPAFEEDEYEEEAIDISAPAEEEEAFTTPAPAAEAEEETPVAVSDEPVVDEPLEEDIEELDIMEDPLVLEEEEPLVLTNETSQEDEMPEAVEEEVAPLPTVEIPQAVDIPVVELPQAAEQPVVELPKAVDIPFKPVQQDTEKPAVVAPPADDLQRTTLVIREAERIDRKKKSTEGQLALF